MSARAVLLGTLVTLGCTLNCHGADSSRSVELPHSSYFDTESASGRHYRISVALPGRAAPPAGYAVVYINDADTKFIHFVESLRLFERRPDTPQAGAVLLVGIGYPEGFDVGTERAYDLTPSPKDNSGEPGTGGAAGLLDFINDELKPLLEERYGIDENREAIYGHSFGGLFGLYALFSRPDSFDYYLLSSPSIWWDQRSILDYERAFLEFERMASRVELVSFTVGEFEEKLNPDRDFGEAAAETEAMLLQRAQVSSSHALADRLSEISRLKVDHRIIPSEDHGSVVPAAIVRHLTALLNSDSFSAGL